MLKRIITISAFMLLLVACGDKTIDASNFESLQKSTKAMMESLSPEDKAAFNKAMTKVIMKITIINTHMSQDELITEMGRIIGGKTAKQIIEMGNNNLF